MAFDRGTFDVSHVQLKLRKYSLGRTVFAESMKDTRAQILLLQKFFTGVWGQTTSQKESSQNHLFAGVLQVSCLQKFGKSYKKTPAMELFIGTVVTCWSTGLLQKRIHRRYFPVRFATPPG